MWLLIFILNECDEMLEWIVNFVLLIGVDMLVRLNHVWILCQNFGQMLNDFEFRRMAQVLCHFQCWMNFKCSMCLSFEHVMPNVVTSVLLVSCVLLLCSGQLGLERHFWKFEGHVSISRGLLSKFWLGLMLLV